MSKKVDVRVVWLESGNYLYPIIEFLYPEESQEKYKEVIQELFIMSYAEAVPFIRNKRPYVSIRLFKASPTDVIAVNLPMDHDFKSGISLYEILTMYDPVFVRVVLKGDDYIFPIKYKKGDIVRIYNLALKISSLNIP